MVLQGHQVIGFWDKAQSIKHDIVANPEFHNDMCGFATKMEENGNPDLDFKKYMLWIASESEDFAKHGMVANTESCNDMPGYAVKPEENGDSDSDFKNYLPSTEIEAEKFVKHNIIATTEFRNDMREYARNLEENGDSDLDFKKYMLLIASEVEKVEPCKKRKEVSDDINKQDSHSEAETEDDPQYELFLENLVVYGSSYAIECEKDGSRTRIPYEVDIDSKDSGDQEPRRKLRSGINQKHELQDCEIHGKDDFNSTPVEKMESQRNSRHQDKGENKKNILKCFTNNMVEETDYHRHIQTLRVVDNHIVATYGDHTIVYHKDGKNEYKKEEFDDDESSDMEILDRTTFYKLTQEFRQSLLAVLRKPYQKEEYDKLWQDATHSRPQSHYKDLRGGREYTSKMKDGKCYLDGYPDLRMKLLQVEDDGPMRLNMLRGFFFWLQNLARDGAFKPWEDKDCLSTRPEP